MTWHPYTPRTPIELGYVAVVRDYTGRETLVAYSPGYGWADADGDSIDADEYRAATWAECDEYEREVAERVAGELAGSEVAA